MKKILFILLLLTSCATFTVHNINVYDRQIDTKFTEQEITELIDFSLDILGYEKIFKGWDFVFTNAWMLYGIKGKNVSIVPGYTHFDDKVIFIKVRECYWDSAIIHEMMHVILRYNSDDGDRSHNKKEVWERTERVEQYMIDHYCPPEYKRSDNKIPKSFIR